MVSIQTFRHFAHEHDDLPAFHAGYLVVTFLAAVLLNLGAFAAMIVFHMTLDLVKYRDLHGLSWGSTLRGTHRESLLDITLFLLALFFAVYFHHATSIVAVSGFVRAEETLLLALGTLIPKVEILNRFVWLLSTAVTHLGYIKPAFQGKWTTVERLYLFSSIVSIVMIMLAPSILSLSADQFKHILESQLIPWRI